MGVLLGAAIRVVNNENKSAPPGAESPPVRGPTPSQTPEPEPPAPPPPAPDPSKTVSTIASYVSLCCSCVLVAGLWYGVISKKI